MINFFNHENITVPERKEILERALNATPFFHLLQYEVVAGAGLDAQFAAKVEVNKDFYLTEMRSNFGEVEAHTDAFFNINTYITDQHKSVYHYNRSQPLQSGLMTTDARFTNINFFDDRQRESIPYRIPRGNRVISEIENTNTKTNPDEALIALVGFTINRYPFLDELATERINRSFRRPTRFEYFRFNVPSTLEGQQTFNVTNDSFPRLVLGFGAINSTTDKAQLSESTIVIKDTTREIRWNNDPMPLEMLAPRLTCVEDTHLYYLPIEYYFQPFGNLQFEVTNESQDAENPQGYEFYVLTRTV